MSEDQQTRSLQQLFDDLPITIAELARESGINEVTLARIRDGKKTRRDTVNKLLRKLSQIYEQELNVRNVTGINIMVNRRLERKTARNNSSQAESSGNAA